MKNLHRDKKQKQARCAAHLVSRDGDEVHGVVYCLKDPQDGGERLLQVVAAIATLAVLQEFLKEEQEEEEKENL